MKIQPLIAINPKTNTQVNFKTNCRVVTNEYGQLMYRATTSFFRGDLNWQQMAEFLCKKYAKADKINIVDFGCSSGEEAYSILWSIIKACGGNKNEYKKFLPILAFDIDSENIKDARSGYLFADGKEKSLIELMTKKDNSLIKFYDVTHDSGSSWLKYRDKNQYMVHIAPEYQKHIKFSVGDILSKINTLPDKNNVIFCRNIWPYLQRIDQLLLLSNISEKLKNTNSVIIFGDYDNPNGTESDYSLYSAPKGRLDDNGSLVQMGIRKNNFKSTYVKNVFEI